MITDRSKHKILIAADGFVSDNFRDTIKKELPAEIELFYFDATVRRRLKRVLRHISYFFVAVRAFKNRNNYKGIIFWQQFIGIYYGLLTRFLGAKTFPPSVTFHFIYKERKGLIGWLLKGIFKRALEAEALAAFVCYSDIERDYYLKEFGGEFENKIFFKTLGIDIPTQVVQTYQETNRYFFSGGTSNRDYSTLLRAFEGSDVKLVIACLPKDVRGLKAHKNVEIIHNSFGQDFLEKIGNAYGVIIPLENPRISSGQLVLLTAMALGKPIIITKGGCAQDYVSQDCALLVRDHSEEDIRESVQILLRDRKKANLLAVNALMRYKERFTLEAFGKNIAEVFKVVEIGVERSIASKR